MSYIIFRCIECGRFLYTEESHKTRECPCGKTVEIRSAKKIGKTDKREKAKRAIMELQEKENEEPYFRRYSSE